jgi:hypothetical protein
MGKQEVLARTNGPLFFNKAWTVVSIEPLRSNDKAIHRMNHRLEMIRAA